MNGTDTSTVANATPAERQPSGDPKPSAFVATSAADTKKLTQIRQNIQGPDQKWYKVKKEDLSKFDDYFKKQGWIKKGDKWYTQSGEEAKMGVPSPSAITDPTKTKSGTEAIRHGKMAGAALDYTSASLAPIGGITGGYLTGSPQGAYAGGLLGELGNQLIRRFMLDPLEDKKSNTIKQAGKEIIEQSVIQGFLHHAGDKVGDVFFKLLDRIPHAKMIEGIPFLPSEYKENGSIYRYVEAFLSKAIPSTNIMEKFRIGQTSAIETKLGQLAEGMAKFKGTSEDMGNLLQGAIRQIDKDANTAFAKQAVAAGAKTKEQALKILNKDPAFVAYKKAINMSLLKAISKTESPSLIGGYIRNESTGSVENIKTLVDILNKNERQDILAKAQNRVMRDMISEALKGSKDPVGKGVLKGQYTGVDFEKIFNTLGEERAKAFFGPEIYKNITNFMTLTSKVGTTTSMPGLVNLAILLPFRNGISLKSGSKLAFTGLFINRMAKAMTSEEGFRLFENEARAVAMGSVKGANAAREAIKKYNERSDMEYQLDQEEAEREYEDIQKVRIKQ